MLRLLEAGHRPRDPALCRAVAKGLLLAPTGPGAPCPVSSEGWLGPAAAGAQGWGMFSSGERAGAGGSSRLRSRHVGMVTAKEALAGSEADLLVMPGISSHHLPACSSSPRCFPLPSPSSRSVDFPAALPQYLPSTSQLQPLQCCSPRASPSLQPALPLPCPVTPSCREFPRLSIPFFSWAPPYPPRSLQRLLPTHEASPLEQLGHRQTADPAECPNWAPQRWVTTQ